MSPEILAHQLESQSRPKGEVIDVASPEQAAYLLPYAGETAEEGKGDVFIAINPLVGDASEVHELLDGLEHDLNKDLVDFGVDTRQVYTPMMFADETGVLDTLSDPATNEKIDKMLSREIPGEIPSLPAIRLKADSWLLDNPLFAEATAALIGKRLQASGRTDEAWMDNLTADKPEGVCIQTGEYSLPGAITEEHSIPNLDKCIREEVSGMHQQRLVREETQQAEIFEQPGMGDIVSERARHMSETGFHGKLRHLIGRVINGDDHSQSRPAH